MREDLLDHRLLQDRRNDPQLAAAAERDQLVVPAVAAAQAQAQEAVGRDAAFEESVELVLDELRQVGAGSVFDLGEEGRGVLLNQAVPRGLFRAVAVVVNRGAARGPLGRKRLGAAP